MPGSPNTFSTLCGFRFLFQRRFPVPGARLCAFTPKWIRWLCGASAFTMPRSPSCTTVPLIRETILFDDPKPRRRGASSCALAVTAFTMRGIAARITSRGTSFRLGSLPRIRIALVFAMRHANPN